MQHSKKIQLGLALGVSLSGAALASLVFVTAKPSAARTSGIRPHATGKLLSADQSETTIGPEYKDAPELTPKDDVPKGTVSEFVMDSKDSKIYPGIAKNQPGTVPYQRRSGCMFPSSMSPERPRPLSSRRTRWGAILRRPYWTT